MEAKDGSRPSILNRIINKVANGNLKNGKEKPGVDRITKRSWVEKVTDDSNVWLQAVRLEAEGDYKNALHFYQEDAEEFKKKGLSARVGLSSLSAGRCYSKLGFDKLAKKAYCQAGEFYKKYAEEALESSAFQASWGFARAAECYNYGAFTSEAKALEVKSKEIRRNKKRETKDEKR